MTKRIPMLLFAVLLALAAIGQASARVRPQDQIQTNNKNVLSGQTIAMLVPQRCFSSGSGATFLKICITDNGNISWFESPAGKVHLQSREGYAVCSSTNGSGVVHGFDANVAASGWGVSTVSEPNGAGTFPLIVTRHSLDGVIQFKQTFTLNVGERGIDAKMDVTNTSASSLQYVWISRYFDGDIDGVSTNAYDRTSDSVWGKDPADLTRGLMLTAAPSATNSTFPSLSSYSAWNPNAPGSQYARGCSSSNYSASTGDYVGVVLTYLPGLAPGQTKSLTLRYRRF